MGFEADRVVLMDNGSLRAEAVFSLRRLAESLGERIGREVDAVSLLHSSKVAVEELGGMKAEVMVPYLKRLKGEGVERVVLIPLFFGPSLALTEYLPGRLEVLSGEVPEVKFAEVMVVMDDRDESVAKILAEGVRKVMRERDLVRPLVALVDHGTPVKVVNDVRERVAGLLWQELGESVGGVVGCSMERREGTEYDFNEPLLERVLEGADGDVVASLLFAAPGRHAGEGGDIAEICKEAESLSDSLRVFRTGLFSEDVDEVVNILAERFSWVTE